MLEENLIPYRAEQSIAATAVLVLAPHPDDEVFGCGGAIAMHVTHRCPVHILILSNGDQQGNSQIRQNESRAAATVLGASEPQFWDLPDRAIVYHRDLVVRITQFIQAHGIDLVYCPSPYELHPDHRQTALIATEVLAQIRNPLRIAFYEVSAPLHPNLLLDISVFLPRKEEAIACFSSQLNVQGYGEQVLALNRYRTYTLDSSIRAAEAFWLVDAKAIANGTPYWPWSSPERAPLANQLLPRVSVIIRSTDRIWLGQALASLAVQTYRHLEILVIAALPEHSPPPAFCGPFAITFIPTDISLSRTQAANRGLDHAHGDFILLLDDDDWLMPDHIERLVSCLAANPLYRAAFCAVALVDVNNSPTGEIFDFPYDPIQLQSRNLFPIHAVLFSRSLVLEGCRFDEQLELYEDWDFWLQVSHKTLIARITGVSAAYRIHTSSGIHHDSHNSRDVLYQKWSTLTTKNGLATTLERVWQYSKLLNESTHFRQLYQTQLDSNLALQNQLREEIQKNTAWQRQMELTHHQLHQILHSKSWRLMAPLRAISTRMRQFMRYSRFAMRLLVRPQECLRLSQRAWIIYRNHGSAGVRAAIRNKLPVASTRQSQDYGAWIRIAEPSEDRYSELKAQMEAWSNPACISILMPTFNSNLHHLAEAIASVREQLYPHWQLCIADDASSDSQVREFIIQAAQNDPRICYVMRNVNGHISAASNSALALADGDFCALLDHDDRLHPLALWHLAHTIQNHPQAGLIYSDEDKINEQGMRCMPYFKCEFNPELMLAHNMVSHLGCYRTSEIRAVGGFREGLEGSQDYDLALRIIERLRPEQIIHIPHVLYHWRITAQSTASSLDAKSYAQNATIRALTEHLERRGLKGHVSPCPDLPHIGYRVQFTCPEPHPKVSIIIPTRDKASLLKKCVYSILQKSSYTNYEIIVIDNGSEETSTMNLFAELRKHNVTIIRDERPFNYSSLNNQAARLASGEYLCLLNNDIEIITPDWLEEMVSFASQADIGAVGARLWYPDYTIQHAGVIVGLGGVAGHAFVNLKLGDPGYFGRAIVHQSYSAVTGACLVIRKAVFDAVGGLNENLAIAFNDVDFCLRVRAAGYRNVWTPYAQMFHHESASRGIEDTPSKVARFESEMAYIQEHWGNLIQADPAYSPNLSLGTHHFEMAYPPRTFIG